MGFVDLLMVALSPVVKTLLITALGLILALEKVNVLRDTARHYLNNLVFFVFTPALVSSSLAETITLNSLTKLWFMPVNILLTFIIGSALGWVLVKVTRTPRHLHGLVIGCCAAGNLGNLLLIIIPAVCADTNSPFGDSIACSSNGEAYASLSMAIGAVYIWTYVYNIIRAYGVPATHSTLSIQYSGKGALEITPDSSMEEALISKDYANYYEKMPIQKKIKQQMKVLAAKINLKMLFAPSTIATIVGLGIGAYSPLRNLLVGRDAPLGVIDSTASMLGDPTIPSMTLIIGANLLKGLKKSEIGIGIIIGVQVVRYIAMPLVGILVVKAAVCFGLVGSDSLYQFVLLLQYALPSAMTIGTITQLFEVGESECSVIMLWNYAVASLALTLWSTYYMWILS